MKRTLTYLTGGLALLIVATSAISAIAYAVAHGTETIHNLATSTLSGIGISIGGLIGTALTMRFQTSRDYLKKIIDGLK